MLPYRRNSRKTRSYLFERIEFHVEFSRCTQNDLLNHWSHTGRRDWNKTINELLQRRARSGVPKTFHARFSDLVKSFWCAADPNHLRCTQLQPARKTPGTERVRKVTTETKVHGRKGDEFLCPFSCLSLSQSEVNLIVTVTYLRMFFPHSSPAACSWLLIGSCRCVRQLWLVRIIPRLYHAFSPLF